MALSPKKSSSKKSSPDKKKPPSSAPASPAKQPNLPPGGNTAAGEYLLERLRILLQRLQATTDILQQWPETQGDSAKVHADTAAALVVSIRKIVTGLRGVERHVNGTGPAPPAAGDEGARAAFRTSLEDKCPVPLDLLDLLDVGGQAFGLNPQCYARGLMKEAMRQLAGLERRKRALAMLAQSIEVEMEHRRSDGEGAPEGGAKKRKREG